MLFCKNCGEEIKEGAKFCSRCGNPLTDKTPKSTNRQNNITGTPCPKCGSLVPLGNIACTKCGSLLNPDKHTAAIVLGYICSIFIPLLGIIFGIYLLTRPNKDVHKHGIIMIILSIIMGFILWLFISYMAYSNSMHYYNNYYNSYNRYGSNGYYNSYYDY